MTDRCLTIGTTPNLMINYARRNRLNYPRIGKKKHAELFTMRLLSCLVRIIQKSRIKIQKSKKKKKNLRPAQIIDQSRKKNKTFTPDQIIVRMIFSFGPPSVDIVGVEHKIDKEIIEPRRPLIKIVNKAYFYQKSDQTVGRRYGRSIETRQMGFTWYETKTMTNGIYNNMTNWDYIYT